MSGVLQFKLINIGRCFQKNAALLNTLRSSIRRSHSFHERYLGQMRNTIKPLINHKTLFGSTTIGVGLVGFGYFNKMNLFSDHHNLKEYFNNFIKLLMEDFFRTAKCESEKKINDELRITKRLRTNQLPVVRKYSTGRSFLDLSTQKSTILYWQLL